MNEYRESPEDLAARTAQQDREEEVSESATHLINRIKERFEWIESEADLDTRQNMVEDLDYALLRALEEIQRF